MKHNRILLYAIAFLQGMVFYASIATLYREVCGITIFQITLIESISLILSLSLELPWGVLAERAGYRRTIIICCFIYVISKIIFWQASNFLGFLIERILLAVVCSGLSGTDVSLLYLSSEPGHSQRSFSIYENLSTGGLLISSMIYSVLIRHNYRLAALLTIFSYAAAFLLSLGLHDIKSKTAHPKCSYSDMVCTLKFSLHSRKLICLLLATAFISETSQMLTVFISQMKYASIGMSNALTGLAYTVMTGVGMLGICSARITERFGTAHTGILSFLAVCVSCIVLTMTQNTLLCILCISIIRLAANLFLPLSSTLQNDMISSRQRAMILSMNALLMESLAACIDPVFGALANKNLNLSFVFGAVLSVLGLLLYIVLSRQNDATLQSS